MIQTAIIELSRTDAENAFNALTRSQHACAETMKAIERKRSWRESEKAMTLADYKKRWDSLELLRAKIGEAFNIGGY